MLGYSRVSFIIIRYRLSRLSTSAIVPVNQLMPVNDIRGTETWHYGNIFVLSVRVTLWPKQHRLYVKYSFSVYV